MHGWLYLPLLLIAVPAAAQDVPAPTPAADPAPAADALAFISVDERMTVPVRIGDAGPYRFVIDTGAQRTVVSRELAATLRLAAGPAVHLTAMTGTHDVGTVVIPAIAVAGLSAQRVEAPALSGVHLGAPGMLGLDMLKGHAVTIDSDRHEMTVTPSRRRYSDNRAEPGEIVVRARNLFGQLVVTDAYCDGQRVRVILDTGSVVSVGNEALRRRFARRNPLMTPIALLSVTGETLIAASGRIGRIRLGAVSIADLPIAFAEAAPFRQFGLVDEPAIMLGMDALALFRRVEIDFANREVRLSLPRDVRHDD